jgi:LuxR family maltose regulon positive regulatory protein
MSHAFGARRHPERVIGREPEALRYSHAVSATEAVGDADASAGGELPGLAPGSYRAPRRSDRLIARQDLVQRLRSRPPGELVVVAAPAGYGKTSTVTLWDAADERRFAWANLDERDDDPVHLLGHVLRALSEIEPIDPEVMRLLRGGGRSLEVDVLPSVEWSLRGRAPFVLVLDDVHYVASPDAGRILDGLVRLLPPVASVVLIGRGRPSMDLARRRMSGGLYELSETDLAMDGHEAAALLDRAGIELDEGSIHDLVVKTEGWPGGLHLAGLALARREVAARPGAFSGRDRLVADYLFEEVLDGSNEIVRQFLLRSSVLDRMRAPLLDELLGTTDAARMLGEVERSGNLFLVPLDGDREWFRYHHLFGDMLRAHLEVIDPPGYIQLHRRASEILERHGDADGAIRHAVAAGDEERAADLILHDGPSMVWQGRGGLLGRWLELLTPATVEEVPAGIVASAWYGVAVVDVTRMLRAMRAAEAHASVGPLRDGSPSVAVAMAMVRSLVALQGLDGVLADTEIVRTGGSPESNPWWGIATGVQATAHSMLGDYRAARERLLEALPTMIHAPAFEASACAHLALLDLYEHDLADAEHWIERAFAIARRVDLEGVAPATSVFVVGALVTARSGRPDEARRLMETARSLLARLGDAAPRTALLGYVLLAKAALALGDPSGARTLAREAERARRRDASPIDLVRQLGEVHEQLSVPMASTSVAITPLTAAELRVLPFLATHLTLQEVADRLIISRNTAKSHAVAIYRKLGVSSRSAAVSEARRLGLIVDPAAD